MWVGIRRERRSHVAVEQRRTFLLLLLLLLRLLWVSSYTHIYEMIFFCIKTQQHNNPISKIKRKQYLIGVQRWFKKRERERLKRNARRESAVHVLWCGEKECTMFSETHFNPLKSFQQARSGISSILALLSGSIWQHYRKKDPKVRNDRWPRATKNPQRICLKVKTEGKCRYFDAFTWPGGSMMQPGQKQWNIVPGKRGNKQSFISGSRNRIHWFCSGKQWWQNAMRNHFRRNFDRTPKSSNRQRPRTHDAYWTAHARMQSR